MRSLQDLGAFQMTIKYEATEVITMFYTPETRILSEKARILVKEKQDKFYKYIPIKKIIKLLEKGKELYSMSNKQMLNQILSIEFVGLQEFYELFTFSGGKLYIGIDCQVYVDDEWVSMEEIVYYEKLYYYDILGDLFRDTFITQIAPSGTFRGYKVAVERNDGIIVDSLIIRFENDPEPEEINESEEEAVITE